MTGFVEDQPRPVQPTAWRRQTVHLQPDANGEIPTPLGLIKRHCAGRDRDPESAPLVSLHISQREIARHAGVHADINVGQRIPGRVRYLADQLRRRVSKGHEYGLGVPTVAPVEKQQQAANSGRTHGSTSH